MMLTEADAAVLERIRCKVDLFENHWLTEKFETPAEARAKRLKLRNAAIRAARHHCPGPNLAKAIEAGLVSFVAEWWTPEEGLRPISAEAPLRDRLLHTIFELNGFRVLGWRRIHDVLNERPTHE